MRTRTQLYLLASCFTAFGLAWLFNGQGVIRDDPDRNIAIPDELIVPLQVRAAYNGDRIFFQYRWPAQRPHVIHDIVKYENAKWVTYGEGNPGPEKHGIHEDRVAMMVDDGSVPEFARYGGYITIGQGLDSFSGQITGAALDAHPLGQKHGVITKYLPATRTDASDWSTVVADSRLKAQREAGYFLDLWHWRAGRSNPVGKADDQHVAEDRGSDSGKATFATNWDKEKKQPKYMFNPAKAGKEHLRWDDVGPQRVSFDGDYYLTTDNLVPFDANHPWEDGDVLPRRYLQSGEGSRADIAVEGRGHWQDGYWTVTLARAMDTGNPTEDKVFRDGGTYPVAFAIHRHATGLRWHYVSLPLTVGLDREADFAAARFTGATPSWDQPWHNVKLFYPGQVNWPLLTSTRHAGAEMIRKGIPVRFRHSEEQLTRYGVEAEFMDEIIQQWRFTLLAGLLLFAGLGFGLTVLQKKGGE